MLLQPHGSFLFQPCSLLQHSFAAALGYACIQPCPSANMCTKGVSLTCCRFRDASLGYACGGSGSLFKTSDGGDSWKRVRATDDVAGNLYAIKWQKNGAGYILGNDGILLRFIA